MSKYLNGIDISSYQGNIDLSKIPSDFVIIKATEGKSYVNPYCDSRYQLAKKASKLLGVYHYAKNLDAHAEAEFFFKNVKGYIGESILFLDYEENISANSPTWCRMFLDHLKELTGGHKGMLYTYEGMLNKQNWQMVKDGDYGLWYANYGTNQLIQGFKQPSAPSVKFWGTPAIYQYNSQTHLPGYNGNLDANMFYGDRNAWLAYATVESKQLSVNDTTNNQKSHDNLVIESPIQKSGGQQAKLEVMKEAVPGILSVKGWQGPGNHRYGYIFLMDSQTGKELARVATPGIVRDDVNEYLDVAMGLKYGMQGEFDVRNFVGKDVYVMFRRTNDPTGNTNSGYQDFRFENLSLTNVGKNRSPL
ncbi:hypothetical protein A5844_000863 [Enterococcus sp. 10A9_DIV0425]|uniref:Lysozyme n=1 Tax=Candidatus Enterococcus wittei TaxID=1987383 RepID=A0A2C9XR16_9ENTE|nr:GH25 family lysozyme [Enterococcus sp. 10A9_DIV0425]OTP12630.1 hypothetical protein A5844_000863 [Enterococcus sp. 10A9_DIV0425]